MADGPRPAVEIDFRRFALQDRDTGGAARANGAPLRKISVNGLMKVPGDRLNIIVALAMQ